MLLCWLCAAFGAHHFARADAGPYPVDSPRWVVGDYDTLRSRLTDAELCLLVLMSNHSRTLAVRDTELLHLYVSRADIKCDANIEAVNGKLPLTGIRNALVFRQNARSLPSLPVPEASCGVTYPDKLPFLLGSWKFPQPPRFANHPVNSIVNLLLQKGVENFYFFGDSIAEQISSIFGVDQARYAQDDKTPIFTNIRKQTYLPCGLEKIGATAKDSNFCATANIKECTLQLQADFMETFLRRWCEKLGPSHKVFVIHPFGTHIWNTDIHTAPGIARGLIQSARAIRELNATLLFLESPSQHFIYDYKLGSNGLQRRKDIQGYSGVWNQNLVHLAPVGGPCCGKITKSKEGNFRNEALLSALRKQDRLWQHHLGWIKFYDMSTIEGSKLDRKNDCTHPSYSPFFFDPIWRGIEDELVRLWNMKSK